MRRLRGLSLAEVLLAGLIVAIGLLPGLDVLTSAMRQDRQTADHEMSVLVTQKVAQELCLASWENDHFSRQLEFARARTQAPSLLVNGANPYFETVDDERPPLDRLRAGEDPGITQASGPLFVELSSYTLATPFASRTLPTTGHVFDVDMNVNWTDFRGLTAASEMRITLDGRAVAAARPVEVTDRKQADELIRQALFRTRSGADLPAVVASAKARLDVVRDLGDTVLVLTGLQRQTESLLAQAARLEVTARAGDTASRAQTALMVARTWESVAALDLAAVRYLAGPARRLAAGFELEALGDPPPPRDLYSPAIRSLFAPVAGFEAAILQARLLYAQLHSGPMARAFPRRTQTRLFQKVLCLRKLEALTAVRRDVTALRRMLVDFFEYQEGRNPSFAAFAEAELEDCRTPEELESRYPDPESIAAYRSMKDIAPRAIRRLTAP